MAGFLNLPPAIRAGGKPNAGPRQSAIAHHMGAPRAASKPAGKPKAAAPPKAAPKPVAKGLGSSQKAIGNLNYGDVVNRATTLARGERNVALAPLKAQATEIGANEQGVQQRYGQLQGAQNTQLEKIQQGQEASAKTFQNQMAENALTQGKAIETAGQTQASMTGGFVSPELRAQQALSSQQAAGQGGAGSAFAQSVAAGGANEIAQMRAAASLSALGGSQNITGVFQKQLAANQQAQQGVLGKVGPRTTELEEKIGQTNFADQAAKAKLAHENIKIGQAGAKIRQTGELGRERNRVSGANAALGARTSRENAQEAAATSRQNKQADLVYKETHPTGTSKGRPKAPSPAEGRKYMGNVSKAEAIAHQQGITSGTKPKRLTEVRKYLQGLGYTGDEVSAAMNLAYYGVLGPKDRETAEKGYGLTKKMRPNWFKPHK